MRKQIGILGTQGRVPGAAFMDTPDLLSQVGHNTGNLFFQYAVAKSFTDSRQYVGQEVSWSVEEAREKFRLLVVPSANFIREDFDLTGLVDYLETVDLPLVVLGLGAQAENYTKRTFRLHASIHRLLEILKERVSCIGVRGSFTAEILSDMGITNVQVIGCPSNFVNRDPNFIQRLISKWNAEPTLITTTGDEPWPNDPRKRAAERRLVAIARESGGSYVIQSVLPFVQTLRSANRAQIIGPESEILGSLRTALAPELDDIAFRRFLGAQVRLYIDVDQWLEDSSRYDLSLGLRLHGNMVSHQAGCPSIWIYHDARTQELCETMALPSMSVDTFLSATSMSELKASVPADFTSYAVTREKLYRRYEHILTSAGLTPANDWQPVFPPER